MTTEEIQEKLKDIIKPYVQNHEAFKLINADTHILQDLQVNSANLVDIIIDAEEVFNIEIDDDEAEQMMTVKDAVGIIEKLVKA